MWNWLAKGAQKAVEFGAEYMQHAALARRLLSLPPDAGREELATAILAMDDRAYTGFKLTIAGLILQQQQAGTSLESKQQLRALHTLQKDAEALRRSPEKSAAPARAIETPRQPNVEPSMNVAMEGVRDKLAGLMNQAGGASYPEMLTLLKGEFDKQKHRFDGARAAGLESVMQRLSAVVNKADDPQQSPQEKMARLAKVQALIAEMLPKIQRPTTGLAEPEATGRAGQVLAILREHKAFIAMEAARSGKADGETERVTEFFGRLAQAQHDVQAAGEDEERVIGLESDMLRALAIDLRAYARRSHAMLAHPVWSRSTETADANAVFFSGSMATLPALSRVAEHLRLSVKAIVPLGVETAEARWRDLRAAPVALFDISDGEPHVFYELGIALTLGTQLLIIARDGTRIPFDVAQEVQFYRARDCADADLPALLEVGLTSALYGVQIKQSAASSISATLDYARRLAASDKAGRLARVSLLQLEEAAPDPVQFGYVLANVRQHFGGEAGEVVLPRWAGAYPDPDSARCFIVMPFRDRLEAGYQAIVEHCQRAHVAGIRGDVTDDQEIIESIWDELCRATHVTVDLTDFNANVCIELGIADTLGRPTFLMGQPGTETQLFPAIAKRRCHIYRGQAPADRKFHDALARFLGEPRRNSAMPRSTSAASPPPCPPLEPAATTIAGLWSGVLSNRENQQQEFTLRFSGSGNPVYCYHDKQGYHEDELTHAGQRIQYVPPGGGVVSVDVAEVHGSASGSGYLLNWSFERAAHGYMDQDYSRIALKCQLRGDKLAVVYAAAGQNYVSGSGMMVGGDQANRYEGLLERSREQ